MRDAVHDLIDNACTLAADTAAGLQTEQGRRQAALAVGALLLAAALKLTLRLGWAGLRRLAVGKESDLLAKLREHLADPNATLCRRVEQSAATYSVWDELKGYGDVRFRMDLYADGRLHELKAVQAGNRDVLPDLQARELAKLFRAVEAALARVRERDRLESRRKSLEALNKA